MRAIWSGSVTFGLVNIPIKLFSAISDTHVNLDMLDKKDLSPIRYAKISKSTGKEIPFEDIVKGFKTDEDQYVVITQKDFDDVSPEKTKAIDIIDFVKDAEIDPIYYDKPYYLQPEKNAAKSYALLKEALVKSKMVGVALFVLRNKEHLSILKPYGDILILHQLRFSDEIKDPEELNIPTSVTKPKELDMALALIDQLSTKFVPENYKDNYTTELLKIIEAKSKGKKPVKAKAPDEAPSQVKDLMSLLKESLNVKKKIPEKTS